MFYKISVKDTDDDLMQWNSKRSLGSEIGVFSGGIWLIYISDFIKFFEVFQLEQIHTETHSH